MLKRRNFTAEFKRQLVKQTCQPGASIAGLAQAHGINANQLHKWRRVILGTGSQSAGTSSALIPVTIAPDIPTRPPTDDPSSGRIDIELGRARISLCGRVDLDALHTVLSMFRPR